MGATPRVSVVVATHQRAERLRSLLAGLRAQTLPREDFEVVLVDDASSDHTQTVIAEELAEGSLSLRTLRHERNEGQARARQDGWQHASAPLIAFTDDDCVPAPTWL